MSSLRIAIIGAGLIGFKRARSLGDDRLIGAYDLDPDATARLAAVGGPEAVACESAEQLLGLSPEVVVVAVPHHLLAEYAVDALRSGSHVLVEKPAGIGVRDVKRIADAAAAADRRVKVGFNHRFHPAIARAVAEAHSGRFGDVMFARARYGHGGRLGYEREWRMRPELSGGGELIDQGMHLFDIFHWLLGPLPLHSALLRTQFWEAVVEDNAVIVLGTDGDRAAPWGTFHVTWTEWKNTFSIEIYCRTGKLQLDGLQGSYGPPRLTIYEMSPELGPPATEVIEYDPDDASWEREWQHFREAVLARDGRPLLGDLESAAYAWSCVEQAQRRGGYAPAVPASDG
ncbi:MAG TPA: Gfo/Idh/MocA family oxidoreductase [Solirubrobacteraceae bacterium]|nr:Gfo/Idh/MocA family oxidoreductase [Solirubrobacteraceae bacterium]